MAVFKIRGRNIDPSSKALILRTAQKWTQSMKTGTLAETLTCEA